MNRLKIFSLLLCSFAWFNIHGQSDTIELTLQETIEMAKSQSPEAQAAKNRFKNSYWGYQTYKAKRLPKLTLNTTLPNFNRSISEIRQDDGSEAFRERSLIKGSADLSLSQKIGFTGGELFLNSQLRRTDVFNPNESTSYLTTPVSIGLRQPLFSFNEMRWQRDIEPLKYKEAKRKYLEAMQQVAIDASNLYFDLYLAQINHTIAKRNKRNKDTLLKIAKGRYQLGKIAENELLEMELSYLNADLSVEETSIKIESSAFKLKSFLGLKEDKVIKLKKPQKADAYRVNVEKAIAEARNNKSEMVRLKKKLAQAERDVARAKKKSGFNADIFATYGLSNSSREFDNLYNDPRDEQQVSLGLEIPILDWGRSEARRKKAISNQKLVRTNVAQARQDFKQEVFLGVQEFNMQAKQLRGAAKADTIGKKRYDITQKRFMIGKVDITDLNNAAKERDQAQRSYIEALRNYWNSRYKMRKLTLYNFQRNRPLEFNPENLIE